jgi:hypothetical protein
MDQWEFALGGCRGRVAGTSVAPVEGGFDQGRSKGRAVS